MPFGLVDDGLHSHVKWRRATKGARALWTTALSWCSDQGNGGHVPADMLRVLDGTRTEAACLVRVGLWEVVADDGWRFHEWSQRNPDARSVQAKKDAESTGGLRGNHIRWHVKRGLLVEGCEWCEESGTDRVADRVANPPAPTPPLPSPSTTQVGNPPTSKSRAKSDAGGGSPIALLAGYGLDESERDAFLAYLATSSDSPSRLVPWLHTHGQLAGRIEQWRIDTKAASASHARPAPTDRQAQILRAEMDRARAADAATNVVHLPQIGAGS